MSTAVQTKQVVKVQRTIGTNLWTASVWEPSAVMDAHATIVNAGGLVYGQVGTRRFESDLPYGSDERIEAVDKHHSVQYEEAYQTIIAEHPAFAGGRRHMGRIVLESSVDPTEV